MLHDKNKIRLVLVDDHPVVINGLQRLLVKEKHIKITGSFHTGAEFISFLRSNEVDIVLLDITLPDMNGMDLCKEIKLISPATRVLALSNHNERSIIMQMLQNGASGYLLKNASAEELVHSIEEVLKGQITFSKAVKEIITHPSMKDLKGVPKITKREKEILRLIADGKTTTVIAEELSISPLTIETHRKNLMQKLEVKNVAALIHLAVQHQLI